MKLRSAYDYYQHKLAKDTDEFGTHITEESLAQASDATETDINVIVERFSKTGQLPVINLTPLTGDFSNVVDFRDAQEKLKEANEAFAQVPAKLRARFDNDPQKFIDYVLDPENNDELVKLGLKDKPKAPPPEPPNPKDHKNGE